MPRLRIATLALALIGILVCGTAWAQPPQEGGLKDQARTQVAQKDEVADFLSWLESMKKDTQDVLSLNNPRTFAAAAEDFCTSAIDPGGIGCALGCPSDCNCEFGYLASRCCCGLN